MTGQHGGEGNRLHVLGISGSLRKASFNSGLLRAAQELAPAHAQITIFDLKDVPLYDGDVEAEGDPGPVTALKSAIRSAQGILFATPEYNHNTSGVLKNAIDWASRDGEKGSIVEKPVTMIGAGGGGGTSRAQAQLQLYSRGDRRSGDGETRVVSAASLGGQVRLRRTLDRPGYTEAPRQASQAFAEWIVRVSVRHEACWDCFEAVMALKDLREPHQSPTKN